MRNPQAPGPRSRSARCSWRRRYDARRLITHFRWSPAFGCLVNPMQASSRWDLTRGDLCSRLHARRRATDFHFEHEPGTVYRFFYFDLTEGPVSGDQPIRPGSPEANSVRACPQRTQTAPIYSAQFPPSVKKRPQLGWEHRDQAPRTVTEFPRPRCRGIGDFGVCFRLSRAVSLLCSHSVRLCH